MQIKFVVNARKAGDTTCVYFFSTFITWVPTTRQPQLANQSSFWYEINCGFIINCAKFYWENGGKKHGFWWEKSSSKVKLHSGASNMIYFELIFFQFWKMFF